jgi:hypothetical protein
MRVLLVATAALLAGCATDTTATLPEHSGSRAEHLLRWLYHADPQRDLAAALARGDQRFVGLHGYADSVPGFDSPYEDLPKRYGVRYLRGTSDAMTSEEDHRLNDLADQYAKKYNALLLQHLRRGSRET